MSDAVVIGSGLGGLLCGSVLSRSGWRVHVLEQGRQIGGALQCFERGGVTFDTGFHSVGGLFGGSLERIFRPLGLLDLPWMEADADEGFPFLRLSTFSSEVSELEREHILEPYLRGVWRLRGGGRTLAEALAADIRSHGGEVLARKRVVSIERGSVTCQDGSIYEGIVISDIHPLATFELCRDHVRPSYLRMLRSRPCGPGIFTVYVKLKPGMIPWHSGSIFLDGLMIHFCDPDAEGRAAGLTLMTPWTSEREREELARECIALASKRFPELSDAVEDFWTSTPSTWEKFTGTPLGSAYGSSGFIPARTPLPGLFLTGQNIGLHGVLGVSMSALATCREILGSETIEKMFGL